jgi:hypothetical protein
MHKRIMRWLVGAACALALVAGLAFGGGRPPIIHGAEPTPTPTPLHTDGNPGGSGGGGGGG